MDVDVFSSFLRVQLEELHDKVIDQYRRACDDEAAPEGVRGRSQHRNLANFNPKFARSRPLQLPSPLPIPVPTPQSFDLPVELPTGAAVGERSSGCREQTAQRVCTPRISVCLQQAAVGARTPRNMDESASQRACSSPPLMESAILEEEEDEEEDGQGVRPLDSLVDKPNVYIAGPMGPIRWSLRHARPPKVLKDDVDFARRGSCASSSCSALENLEFLSVPSQGKPFGIEACQEDGAPRRTTSRSSSVERDVGGGNNRSSEDWSPKRKSPRCSVMERAALGFDEQEQGPPGKGSGPAGSLEEAASPCSRRSLNEGSPNAEEEHGARKDGRLSCKSDESASPRKSACGADNEQGAGNRSRESVMSMFDRPEFYNAGPIRLTRWSVCQRPSCTQKDEADGDRKISCSSSFSGNESLEFVSVPSRAKSMGNESMFGDEGSHRARSRTSSTDEVGFTCGVRKEWIADETLLDRIASNAYRETVAANMSIRSHGNGKAMRRSIGNRLRSVSSDFMENDEFGICMVHPHSRFAFFWDLANLFFILYDIVATPLRLFVLPPNDGSAWADVMVTVFFTCDCLLTFNRGVYVEGELDFTRKTTARKYFKSWFFVDMLVLIPDWTTLIMGSSFLSTVSLLRMLRLTRMLRLLQIDKVVSLFQEQLNSDYIVQVIDLTKHVGCIVLMVHIFACIWCALRRHNGWDPDVLEGNSLPYLYISSLHWSLTQFHGGTDIAARNVSERAYNVVVLFLSMLAYGSYLSRLTDMMLQMEKLHHHKTKAQQVVRKYVEAHNISSQLAIRVKRYVDYHIVSLSKENDLQFLHMLPQNLLLDLLCEGRTPIIKVHTMFQYFQESYPRALRTVCHEALSEVVFSNGDVVFACGDASSHMKFIVAGSLNYNIDLDCVLHRTATVHRTHTANILETRLAWKLRKGSWICEPSVWTTWTNVGCAESVSICSCLLVDAVKLAAVLKHYEEAYVDAVRYAAEYVHALNVSVFATDMGAYADEYGAEPEPNIQPDETHHWVLFGGKS